MRGLSSWFVWVFCLVGGLAVIAPQPSYAADPTSEQALRLKPVQPEVDYTQVDPAVAAECRLEKLAVPGWTGWRVLSPEGLTLRRFADTNGDGQLDLWCYYRDGVETYRDVDRDGNKKADEYRWLGQGGARIGIDSDEDGAVDRWQRISAEEVAVELIEALVTTDQSRFERLLITEPELAEAKLPEDLQNRIEERLSIARRDFLELAKRQTAVTAGAKFSVFAGGIPGAVPLSETLDGPELRVYENALAIVEGGKSPIQIGLGAMVQVGDSWKLMELPQVIADGQAVSQAGLFYSRPMTVAMPGPASDQVPESMQESFAELEKIDRALATATGGAAEKLQRKRIELLTGLAAQSTSATDQALWLRQLTDSLVSAVHSDQLPDAVEELERLAEDDRVRGDSELAAYVAYQVIAARYANGQKDEKDFAKVQTRYLEDLEKFASSYPKSTDAAIAMSTLAMDRELSNDAKGALSWYRQVVDRFPSSEGSRKARGAIRRLESEGQVIELRGKTIDGKDFDLAKLRGKSVIVHFWADWCGMCKQDMVLLRQLQAKYGKRLAIVGVNLDPERELPTRFLQTAAREKTPFDWPQIWDDGGLERGQLSNDFGIQTLPAMMLIDANGKVHRHSIYASELEGELQRIVR